MTMSSNRLSWEEYALKLANVACLRSEDPWHKVGACALDYNNRVLSLGYNGLAERKDAPDSFWHDRDDRRPYMIHAEANCLSLFKAGECEMLATTLLPCSYCATMIAAYKIPVVIYGDTYELDQKALDIFNFYDIKYKQIVM